MRADMAYRDVVRNQHHGIILYVAKLGDQFCMPNEVWIAHPRRFLVHRQRNDSRDFAL